MTDDLNEFHQEEGEDMVKESSKNVDVTAATKLSELDVNQYLKGAYMQDSNLRFKIYVWDLTFHEQIKYAA